MMTFWIVTGIMMVVGVALVMPAIFKRINKVEISRKDLNVSIYQQRIDELEEEKNNGVLDSAQYDQARLELDRTFLNDLSGTDEEGKENNLSVKGKWGTLLSVLILVPALSAPLYLYLGEPELLVSQKDKKPAAMDQNSMLSAINSLVTRLKNEPDNVDGWRLLGRSYASMNRIDDAMLAYEKALKLNGQQDPGLLVDYAEVLMNANEGDPRGFPEQLISRALSISPNHQKSLWLSGIVRYHYGDYDGTLRYWRKLLSMQPKGGEQEAFLKDNIRKVLATQGATSSEPSVDQDGSKDNVTAGLTGSVTVTVSLDSKFKDKAKSNEIVFIYAKAVTGPPMPLAVVRKRVSELPVTITLDDSMAMVPMAKISNFDQIQVSAHISKTGQANRQSGDLFGTSGTLNVVNIQKTEITINQAFP
ncbi:MAG: c-type cytochrome biogenesis protein CcmI [Gammaproteobacteria bacterium]|nr:c-type cytochrome biogenesis protein CcmI [Gammaproteobacteria bacterium]